MYEMFTHDIHLNDVIKITLGHRIIKNQFFLALVPETIKENWLKCMRITKKSNPVYYVNKFYLKTKKKSVSNLF